MIDGAAQQPAAASSPITSDTKSDGADTAPTSAAPSKKQLNRLQAKQSKKLAKGLDAAAASAKLHFKACAKEPEPKQCHFLIPYVSPSSSSFFPPYFWSLFCRECK
jgi:hypothetical protein